MWSVGAPKVDLPLPVWQHGYRCHGYWIEGQRVGFVGLTPRGYSVSYSWGLDAAPLTHGQASTLRAAKRRVEAEFRRLYSWRFPASR